jgi:hypothetical protein
MPPDDAPNHSKSHYSVEEMMERLRHPSGGKRKRRSHQPVVETRKRRRRWIVVVGAIAGGLILAIVLGGMLNRQRLSGEIFRESLNRHFSDMSGMEIEFGRFKPDGWHVLHCSDVQATGQNGAFKSAQISTLRGELTTGSLFRNEWHFNSLSAEKVTVAFQKPAAQSSADPTSHPLNDSFRMGLSAAPSAAIAEALTAAQVHLSWPESGGATGKLEAAKASGAANLSGFQVQLTGGTLTAGPFTRVPVENITLEAAPHSLKIENARLRFAPKSQLRFKGRVDFSPEGASTAIDATLDSLQLQEFLPPSWQNRLSGKLIPGAMKFTAAPGQPDSFTGAFEIEGAVLTGLPFMAALRQRFATGLFDTLEFRTFTGLFRMADGELHLEHLSAFKEGELRLDGNVSILKGGKLQGKLRLGINTPESNIQGFAGEENGLDILEITLGGTQDSPQDDVAAKLGATAAPAAPVPPGGPAQPSAVPPPPPAAPTDPAASPR